MSCDYLGREERRDGKMEAQEAMSPEGEIVLLAILGFMAGVLLVKRFH